MKYTTEDWRKMINKETEKVNNVYQELIESSDFKDKLEKAAVSGICMLCSSGRAIPAWGIDIECAQFVHPSLLIMVEGGYKVTVTATVKKAEAKP